MATLYLGCPVWGLKAWVGNFFPAGAKQRDFLHLYSRRLNTVEGNTTFYALPDADTVARWRDETPPDFRFCLKFPQTITHQKRLQQTESETAAFLNRLALLNERCGPAFLQLPPTFSGRHLKSLITYLDTLPRFCRYAIEPRHADFFGGFAELELDAALRARGMARLTFDTRALRAVPAAGNPALRAAQERKPDFPPRQTRTANFAFVRFVGQPTVEANRPWLEEWATHVAAWLKAGDDVFFFLHNPDDTDAPTLARLFHALVHQRHPLPPLPTWGEPSLPQQPSLL